MLYGRMVGIILLVLGIIFSAIGFSMLEGAGFTIRLFVAGPAMITLGIAMIVVPGPAITVADSQKAGFEPRKFMADAPFKNKIVWGIAGLIGLAVGLLPII